MSKHIVKEKSGKPAAQSEKLSREPRKRNPGEKLRRYTDIERKSDE